MNQFGMSHSDLYPTVYTDRTRTTVDKAATIEARSEAKAHLRDLQQALGSQAIHGAQRDFGDRTAGRKREDGTGAPFKRDHALLPPAKVEAAPRRLKDMSSRKRRRLAAQAFNARRVER